MLGDGGKDWFDSAGLGLFVHWNHSSAAGRELSWPLVGGGPVLPHSGACTVAEYYASVADFAPGPDAARTWCAAAAAAGARYAVLTTRHHDGYALWPSAHTSLGVADSGLDRDLVAEFVDACRAEGLRVGFYLSLSDWHHPDYPAFGDEDRPYLLVAYPRPDAEAWARYVDDLFGQVRELLTDYGEISVLWFDGGWERSAEEWRAAELEALIRELQPGILLNERLPSVGDYTTPEQFVPPTAPDGRWETCLTMNESWGWVPGDQDWKSSRDLVHALCETVGKGGNLLLNVGPRGDGSLDPGGGLPAGRGRRLDGPLRRGHPRHHVRPRALAVVRPVDPQRRPRLPDVPRPSLRLGDRARRAHQARRAGRRARKRPGAGVVDPDAPSSTASSTATPTARSRSRSAPT